MQKRSYSRTFQAGFYLKTETISKNWFSIFLFTIFSWEKWFERFPWFTGVTYTVPTQFRDFTPHFQPIVFLAIFLSIYMDLSVYLSIWIHLSICLSVYLSIWICMSICLFVYLSICLSVYLSICLSVYLSICLSVYFYIYLSVNLSVYLSIC